MSRRPCKVGLDPVMVALLAFWCTVLVRIALAGLRGAT